jgi:hypothetical protein
LFQRNHRYDDLPHSGEYVSIGAAYTGQRVVRKITRASSRLACETVFFMESGAVHHNTSRRL